MIARFGVTITYSQIVVFNSGGAINELQWTDQHVAQGFAWSPGDVAFGVPDHDGDLRGRARGGRRAGGRGRGRRGRLRRRWRGGPADDRGHPRAARGRAGGWRRHVSGAKGGYAVGSSAGRAIDQKLYDWTHAQKQADELSDGDQSRCGNNCMAMAKQTKKSGKEKSDDVPSWAKGQKPKPGENGKDFAGRLLDQQFGPGGWSGTGPTSDFNKLKKYGDRSR